MDTSPTGSGLDTFGPASHDFEAAFAEAEVLAAGRPVPWYRRTARLIAGLAVTAMIATGALVPWGQWIDALDDIRDPVEIVVEADRILAESPYEWLVTDIVVRPIPNPDVGGFVRNNPPDGIIVLDHQGWDPGELASTVSHEIGHLIDFAAWGTRVERRDGLESEVFAECAAVDAGYRSADDEGFDERYRCTPSELDQYRFALSRLGHVCAPWSDSCGVVAPASTFSPDGSGEPE